MIKNKSYNYAFTIVELLVVIVVIGILAAITIVSYSGIRNRAITSAIKIQLSDDSKILKMYYIDNGLYPTTIDSDYCPVNPVVDNRYCLKTMNNSTLTYSGTNSTFLVTIKDNASGITYSMSESGEIAQVISTPVSGSTFISLWSGGSWPYATGVASVSDGSAILTGVVSNVGGGQDEAFFAKYNANGSLTWSKTWGGSGWDYSNAIIDTSDGSFAIAGRTTSFGAGGGGDVFLAKYDQDGNLQWDRTWGSSGLELTTGVTQLNDGGFVVTGYHQDGGVGEYSAFIIKYDSSGTFLWSKSWGGANTDYAKSITSASDGGFAIAGYTHSFGYEESGDAFLAKFDSDGNLSWNRTWGSYGEDSANSVCQSSDGAYVIAGTADGLGAGGLDGFFAKFDSGGNFIWNTLWSGSDNDSFDSIKSFGLNNYVVSGKTRSFGIGNYESLLVTFDSGGNIIWNKTLQYNEDDVTASAVTNTSDGGFALGGRAGAAFIAKYKSDGLINNCGVDMCKDITVIPSIPDVNVSNPSAIITTLDLTKTDPGATTSNLDAINTVLVAN